MKKFAIALVAMLVLVVPVKAGDNAEKLYAVGAVASAFRPFEDSSSSEVALGTTVAVLRISEQYAQERVDDELSVLYDPRYRDKKKYEKLDCEVDNNPYEVVYPVSSVNNLMPVVPVKAGYYLFVGVDPLGFKKIKELRASANGGHSLLKVLYVEALDKMGVVIPLSQYRLNGITTSAQGNDFGREHRGLTILFFKVTTRSKDHRNTASLRIPDLAFVPYEGIECDTPYMTGWAVEVSKLISTHFAGIAPTFDPIHNQSSVARFKEPGKIVDALYYAPQTVVAPASVVTPPVASGPPYSCIVSDREKSVKRLTISSSLAYKVECAGDGYDQGYSTSVLEKGGKVSVQVRERTVVKILFVQNGTLTSKQVWPQ